MNTEEYCSNLCDELVKWKDEIHKENEKIAHYPSAEKQHMIDFVGDMIMLENEMSDRIDQLKNECPTAWHASSADEVINPSDSRTTTSPLSPGESEKIIGGGDFGG